MEELSGMILLSTVQVYVVWLIRDVCCCPWRLAIFWGKNCLQLDSNIKAGPPIQFVVFLCSLCTNTISPAHKSKVKWNGLIEHSFAHIEGPEAPQKVEIIFVLLVHSICNFCPNQSVILMHTQVLISASNLHILSVNGDSWWDKWQMVGLDLLKTITLSFDLLILSCS